MHIGKDRGLFAKYGLTTETIYIPGGSINVQVLVSGNLDLSQLSGAPGVAANLEGADIVYFAGLLDKLNYQLITRPEIKGVEQLKGKNSASAATVLRRISACAPCSSGSASTR